MEDKKKVSYSDNLMRTLFPERICPICGKIIIRAYFGDYAYKRGPHTFCSWGCMRKYDRDPSLIGKYKKKR